MMKRSVPCSIRVRSPFLGLVAGTVCLAGCQVDSFMDPSKTGYFQHTPISTPILERIDVIETGDDLWTRRSPVEPEDLLPSDLEYRIAAGDALTVEIQGLLPGGQSAQLARRIDQAGNLRLPPPLGDFPAAGLTAQELEDAITEFLAARFINDPYVSVTLTESRGFMYTVVGNIQLPGLFPLLRPDLRLDQALAQSGGVPQTTRTIYVIRPVAIEPRIDQPFPRTPTDGATPTDPGRSIEDILRDLDQPGGGSGAADPARLDGEAVVDIDDLTLPATNPALGNRVAANRTDSFVYVEERNEWVRVRSTAQDITDELAAAGGGPMVVDRIIEVDYQRLLTDSSQNLVIRPGDRIYVVPPESGVVYIGGEIIRAGSYNLPVNGHQTLSQLVTAAGGLGALAIPTRVDLTRRVGRNREATIRVNLAAIRKKTEPDIFLKPDDHIIIGTSWVAAPLAVIRNGFRASYGFGFLLDRNFGNDVFGAPPRDRGF